MMLAAKFDPQAFFQRTENVALHVPAGEVFGLLTRSLNLPPQWGALVGRESGGQTTVSAGGIVEAEDAEDVLFVRLWPVPLTVGLAGVRSRDGFSFAGEARFRVRVLPDRADLMGFLKAVAGSRRVIQQESLAAYFEPAVRGAMATFASQQDAEALASATGWQQAADAVAGAMEVPLFSGGMTLDGAVVVTLESGAFRGVQQTRESAAVRQAQQATARSLNESLQHARTQHLDQMAESLARLRQMAADSPGVSLTDLIKTFGDHQRGQLYEAHFAANGDVAATEWIVAVCSDELLFFHAREPAQPARRLRIDGAAGAARSVRRGGDRTLLLGAARGVYVWPIDAPQPEQTLIVESDARPRGGFNAVVRVGERVLASHSELGIRCWDAQTGRELAPKFADLTRDARAVRDLTYFEGSFYCAIDDAVIRWKDDGGTSPDATYRGAGSTLSAIAPTAEGLFAGTSSGDLAFWPAGTTTEPDILQRGIDRAIESIHVQDSRGVRRLVYSDTSPRVHARVIGDSFTFHYEAGGQTLRRVEAAGDLVVAMNELRDKLICWSPARPGEPRSLIPVGAICGRNIQDFCLLPATATA